MVFVVVSCGIRGVLRLDAAMDTSVSSSSSLSAFSYFKGFRELRRMIVIAVLGLSIFDVFATISAWPIFSPAADDDCDSLRVSSK